MSMAAGPRVIIIAGPNGAGKTTFAREFLPNEAGCPVFVNADLIAAGLAPFASETVAIRAGRLMLQEMARHFAANESFAFETTLAGRGYLRLIERWQRAGYRVKLAFLQLASADEAFCPRGAAGTTGRPSCARRSDTPPLCSGIRELSKPVRAQGECLDVVRQRRS